MKRIDKIIEERYAKKPERYLCESCGEGLKYLGSIAGTNRRHCEGCGKASLLKKYMWPKKQKGLF